MFFQKDVERRKRKKDMASIASVGRFLQEAFDASATVNDVEPGVGTAFLIDGFLYASLAGASLVQFVRNICRYRPWTVQKMIHLLMFTATVGKYSCLKFFHASRSL